MICLVVGRDFPGGPGAGTLRSNAGGVGLILGSGLKIPHASRSQNQNIKQKQHGNRFNKGFKIGPHTKKKNFFLSGWD